MAEPIIPFSNGTQFIDWQDRNCHGCTKYNRETFDNSCEIDLALFEAWAGDGSVSAEMGQRMGFTDDLIYTWDCPERIDR